MKGMIDWFKEILKVGINKGIVLGRFEV